MTLYLLPCTCGQNIEVALGQAGDTILCSCGNTVNIPSIRGMKQLQPAVTGKKLAPPKKAWSPLQGALFGVGLLLLVVSIPLSLYNYWIYDTVYNSRIPGLKQPEQSFNPKAEEERLNREIVDQMKPVDTLRAWKELVTNGLEKNRDYPEYQKALDTIQIATNRLNVLKVLMLVGIFSVIVSLVIGKRRSPAII